MPVAAGLMFVISGLVNNITALVLVLDEARLRRVAFKVAIILYLAAVLDMGVNVLVSGVVGWKT